MSASLPSHWLVGRSDAAKAERLASALGLPRMVSQLLVARGYEDAEACQSFLDCPLEGLHDPSLLPDYAAATREILDAKEKGELIYVHGDYDVDGVTSTAIFYRFLTALGCRVESHVPHRIKEGYGIHLMAVEEAAEMGASLFLTCDCGVSAHEQVVAAQARGMRVVVTDHHEPGPDLPPAQAVVNPHREDSKYPFSELSGAGVVFKLCAGLTRDLGLPLDGYYRGFLDLAALGTVADVMPLVDENRIIVRHGLKQIRATRKPGLQALLRVSELEHRDVTATDIGFRLGPRLNAAGRLDDADLSHRLLLTKDEEEARTLATKLDNLNRERRAEQQRICDQAIEQVAADGLDTHRVLLVSNDGWHPGIIGLVASRLVEHFRKPAFVVTMDPETGKGKGSARSVPGFHLADALHAHRTLLLSGGGHEMAAGFSLEESNLQEFRNELAKYSRDLLPETPTDLPRMIDLEVQFGDADFDAVTELSRLQPYGQANSEPTFLSTDVVIKACRPTRKPEHCLLTLADARGTERQCTGFGLGQSLGALPTGTKLHVVFQPAIDEFNGNRTLKYHIRDFALADGSVC